MVLKAPLHFLFSLHLTVRNFFVPLSFVCRGLCALYLDRFDEISLYFREK